MTLIQSLSKTLADEAFSVGLSKITYELSAPERRKVWEWLAKRAVDEVRAHDSVGTAMSDDGSGSSGK